MVRARPGGEVDYPYDNGGGRPYNAAVYNSGRAQAPASADSASMTASAIGLLRTCLAPRLEGPVQPPNTYYDSTFSKRLDFEGIWTTGDDSSTSLSFERVPTQTGLVLWLPQRGVGSVYRMGIVPGGATSVGGVNGLREAQTYLGTNLTLTGLTYGAPLAVPYDATQNVVVDPEVQQNFSTARLFAGDVHVISDTVPIGNTALGGYLSAGAISDTRDVCQINQSGVVQAYPVSSLTQSSVTSKEGVKDIGISDGIWALVGPDIPPVFSAPNADFTDTLNGLFETQGLNFVPSVPTEMGPRDMGVGIPLFGAWVTPWVGLTALTAGFPVGAFTQVHVDNINECGVLDINVNTSVFNRSSYDPSVGGGLGANVGCAQFLTQVVATHIFAVVFEDGHVQYATFGEAVNISKPFGADSTTGTEATPVGLPFTGIVAAGTTCSFRPRMFQASRGGSGAGGFTSTGKYLGTYICCSTVLVSVNGVASDAAGGGFETLGDGSAKTVVLSPPILSVRARDIMRNGSVGPARIIRWDKVSAKQNIKVDGVALAQVVPAGTIAPYTQSAAMFAPQCPNMNVLPWLAELFNGPGPLKRIWTGSEYNNLLQAVAPYLENGYLNILHSRAPKAAAAAEAAGLFSTLGNLAGGLADHIFGAGEFGAESAGQFCTGTFQGYGTSADGGLAVRRQRF